MLASFDARSGSASDAALDAARLAGSRLKASVIRTKSIAEFYTLVQMPNLASVIGGR